MSTKQNTFGIIFFIKKESKNKEGKVPLYARITVNGKRSNISLKQNIAEVNWNEKRGVAKGNKPEIVKLNNYLEEFRSGIVATYQELVLQKTLITAELVKNKFIGADKQEFTILKLIELHNQEEGSVLVWGTMKNYYTTQKYIKKFLKEKYGTNDKYLSELNYKFIMDFDFFLRRLKNKQGKIALQNNGVMKHLERFFKMINLSLKHEWIEKDPFHAYKLKFEKTEREFLTKQELKRLEEQTFTRSSLQTVRDLFVFSCYTGLAYIDVFNLLPSNVVNIEDGELWIKTSRQKTSTTVTVPLLPKAIAVIEKYKEHPKVIFEGKLLPTYSNQKLNSYLKEIALACEITKPLTFHIARHTFATTITLTNGVPIESISKMLGHTKLSTTQIYAKVVESKLGSDMASLRKILG